MNLIKLKTSKGFTLIELIIVAFVVSVGVVGVMAALGRVGSLMPIISSRLTAAYLCQEGIEIIRNIRDANWINGRDWDSGLLACAGGCEADYTTGSSQDPQTFLRSYEGTFLNLDNDNFYSYFDGAPTKYKRRITVEKIGNDTMKVIAKAEWQEKNQSYDFEAEEYLYNWK